MGVLEFALIGIAIGIITTAPVGPVNIMAIQHAAQWGFRQGVLVGIGAVLADTAYAAVAVFGVSAVMTFIDTQVDLIKIVGGLVLLGFGVKVVRSHPHLETGVKDRGRKFLGDTTAAFFMVLTNPGAAFAYVAIMGALGHYRPVHGDYIGALAMVCGVAIGASAWWAMLSYVVTHLRNKIDDRWLEKANRIAGSLLILFGVLIYMDLAFELFL
ncbi:MAG: LysE family transporter [Roseibium sp.]|nr:LysE family transporter [Roseibium sp.]